MRTRTASTCLAFLLFTSLAFAGGGHVARKATAKPYDLFHEKPSQLGTVLMFHGFSNSTAMWRAEAENLFRLGYDVKVAALPGHGFVDKAGNEDVSRVPLAHESAKYQKFASAMFDLARQRSNKVHVVGFSVGGAHAIELALTKQDVVDGDGKKVLRSVVAINPYLSPPPMKLGPFRIDADHAVAVADKLTFGLASRWLQKRAYRFDAAIKRQRNGSLDVGLTQVTYGNVFGIGRLGDAEQARAAGFRRPVDGSLPSFVVITKNDPTASPVASAELARQIGAEPVVVDSNLHNLITEEANPDPVTRDQVRTTIERAVAAGVAAER